VLRRDRWVGGGVIGIIVALVPFKSDAQAGTKSGVASLP
jgi:hypothetical protein